MADALTARRIEACRPPDVGRLELSDTVVRGLSFRVTANGTRTWCLRTKVNGRDRRFALGNYPGISLSEARKRAERLRVEIRDGRDPIAEKRAAREQAQSAVHLSEVLSIYSDMHLAQLADGARRGRALGAGLAYHLSQRADHITGADVQLILDRKARSAPVAANRLRAYIRHFSRWAARRGYVPTDFARDVDRPAAEASRDRVLSMGELTAIWQASEMLHPLWRAYVRLSILTAQRRGDVVGARWEEIEPPTWSIPAARTKTRRAHVVHLSKPALAELEALRTETGPAGLIFTTTGGTPLSGFGRVKRRLDELSGVTEWWFHDLRTAFATHMAGAGEAEGVVDRILNHAATSSSASAVARTYQRNELLEQRARCLDRWAGMVMRAIGNDAAGTVVVEMCR